MPRTDPMLVRGAGGRYRLRGGEWCMVVTSVLYLSCCVLQVFSELYTVYSTLFLLIHFDFQTTVRLLLFRILLTSLVEHGYSAGVQPTKRS